MTRRSKGHPAAVDAVVASRVAGFVPPSAPKDRTMRGFSPTTLLLAALVSLTAWLPLAQCGAPCGQTPCEPPPCDTVQCPAPKVIVHMSPPEVIFQPAPCTTPCEKC